MYATTASMYSIYRFYKYICDVFSYILQDIMDIMNNEHKHGIIMGDMNIDLLVKIWITPKNK